MYVRFIDENFKFAERYEHKLSKLLMVFCYVTDGKKSTPIFETVYSYLWLVYSRIRAMQLLFAEICQEIS